MSTAMEEPKKGRLAQMRQVYTLTRQVYPALPWWMAGAFVGVLLLGILIGAGFGHPVYGGFVAFGFALLAAVLILSRLAERAMYSMMEGQIGATGAALQGLRRGWAYEQQPVAIDSGRSTNMQDAAMVFRAVGKPGVVLIAEGPPGRAVKLLTAEKKRVNRLVPNVPVTTFRIGSGEGENVVSARELLKRMRKLPKKITGEEITAVTKRLNSMSGLRPPVPQGIDPNRIRQMGRGQRR